ncbi:MAG: TPR repeat protein [Phenylobacterium sp.]|jgi:TPR repeat protein
MRKLTPLLHCVISALSLLFCSITAQADHASHSASIGGNETAAKIKQQRLDWQQAITDFANADADTVIAPYMQILSQLKVQPQQSWCRGDVARLVSRALALNGSSLVAWSMRYGCASKHNRDKDKQQYTDTINGLIGLLVKQNQATSLTDAIHIRELLEAPLILQAMGYNILDVNLALKNGGLFYRYHVIDPISSKVQVKYFTNLTFMKQQLNQGELSHEMAIQMILRSFRQQSLGLILKHQAKKLIEQHQYAKAQTMLDDISDYSMIKNVLQGKIYLANGQHQQFEQLSKALKVDAKGGFIAAAILLARSQVQAMPTSQPTSQQRDNINNQIKRVDRFTIPGEGAYQLALALQQSEPPSQPNSQWLKWLNQASEQHHPQATFALAKHFQLPQTPSDSPNDSAKALALFQRARGYGHKQAAIEIVHYYHQQQDKTLHQKELTLLRQLTSENNGAAMTLLAKRYEHGVDVNQDLAAAFDWYFSAWQAGFVDAANHIASLYETGKVARHPDGQSDGQSDLHQAWVWYEKAAEKGDFNGYFHLGRFLQLGLGREIDLKQAAIWYLTAANNGSALAYCHLATTLLAMDSNTGIARQPIREKAQSLYQLGSKQDNKTCPRQFARFYQLELGDQQKAKVWNEIGKE